MRSHIVIDFSEQAGGKYALNLYGQEMILSSPASDEYTYYRFESLDWTELLGLVEASTD